MFQVIRIGSSFSGLASGFDVMVVVGVEVNVEVGWLVEKICSPKKLLLPLQQLPLAVNDLFRGEQ